MEEDYRDNFLKISTKDIINGFVYAAVILACFSALIFCCYLVICFMDRKPPIENMRYSASDAKIGGATTINMKFYRSRICGFGYTRMITDSKGKIVFLSQDERLVNGPIRDVDIDDTYHINANASPGKAVLHFYAFWKCPGNLVHQWNPIFKEYTDTLELSLIDGFEDVSKMSLEDAESYIKTKKQEMGIK